MLNSRGSTGEKKFDLNKTKKKVQFPAVVEVLGAANTQIELFSFVKWAVKSKRFKEFLEQAVVIKVIN